MLLEGKVNRVVICPDVVGRGKSDYLKDPLDYNYNTYLNDALNLINHESPNSEFIDYVGTSMGGLIGLFLATCLDKQTTIRKLVINDVGPYIPLPALSRIGSYVGNDPTFDSRDQVLQYFKKVHSGFGSLTNDQWNYFIEHSIVKKDGKIKLHYDPNISVLFKKINNELNLWSHYRNISSSILVIRGENSDILSSETFDEMVLSTPPITKGVLIENVGHAPTLITKDQTDHIVQFLNN
eukprot:gene814-1019_t